MFWLAHTRMRIRNKVHSDSIQTPFSTFWYVSLILKLICFYFTYYKLKHHIYQSIQTLYSVLCHSDYSLESSWVWRYKLGTPVFGQFLPFFSADPLKLCQVGWGALLHSYFQVSPEMFDRALAGTLKDIQRLVPKPLLCCLGCVLS